MKTLIEKILKNEEFLKKEFIIHGQECVLITPREIGVSWDTENKFFRSVLIKKSDKSVVSMGFGKFMNFWEKPEFDPWDNSWEFEARHKVDGSLILISKFMGELLVRTRGTVSVFSHETGEEFNDLIKKYPSLFDNDYINSEQYTILCEHVTPNRIIVVRESTEPELILLGIIQNKSARLEHQHNCDVVAESWGIKRPKRYFYSSVQECLDDVKAWQDKEGVVLYHEESGTMKKIKADLYLSRHRLRSHISSISNLVDFYMTTSRSADYNEFFKIVEQSLDFELATQAAKDILKVTEAHLKIKIDTWTVQGYVSALKELPRKEAAAKIIAKYTDWRKSYAFMALDNKPMPDKMLAELILQTCKN